MMTAIGAVTREGADSTAGTALLRGDLTRAFICSNCCSEMPTPAIVPVHQKPQKKKATPFVAPLPSYQCDQLTERGASLRHYLLGATYCENGTIAVSIHKGEYLFPISPPCFQFPPHDLSYSKTHPRRVASRNFPIATRFPKSSATKNWFAEREIQSHSPFGWWKLIEDYSGAFARLAVTHSYQPTTKPIGGEINPWLLRRKLRRKKARRRSSLA